MANSSDKWYFTKDQLENTPSRKCGLEAHRELSYRQQTANFIQDMGQRLKVSQLCINTAIVYMHRFYVFHSFTHFIWYQMAAAALFLAAKVEEQPRKLEYVIRVANICRNNRDHSDVNSERYQAQSQELVFNENVLLQTLGFDVAIDHPHTHVVRCCHLVRASKDLSQSSYFLASNSLHLTTMCLQYRPTVVACFCIHLACKWSRWEIPLSTEKKEWFLYVDPTVTAELLKQLTSEFFYIFETCPSRLKEKILAIGDSGMPTSGSYANSPFDTDPKRMPPDPKDPHQHRSHESKSDDPHKHRSSSQQQREREYREKKEREKLALQQQQQHGLKGAPSLKQGVAHHHRPPADAAKLQKHHSSTATRAQPPPHPASRASTAEPRDILREAVRDSPFGLANKQSDSKDVQSSNKRDYLLKPNAAADTNNYNGDIVNNKANANSSRQLQVAATANRDSKRQQSVPGHDRNNVISSSTSSSGYLSKSLSLNSTSQQQQQKHSPLTVSNSTVVDIQSKSVLKQPGTGQSGPPQQIASSKHHHNGNSYKHMQAPPAIAESVVAVKEEPVNAMVKRPSLFSPESSPPKNHQHHQSPKSDPFASLGLSLSPVNSPTKRVRNYSTGSEPELRPVMKKIDQVEGFENLMRDSSIGINKLHQVPDIITPITDVSVKQEQVSPLAYSKEMKPPDIIPPLCSDNNISTSQIAYHHHHHHHHHQPLVNGIETNPVLISSLLKETAPVLSHLPAAAVSAAPQVAAVGESVPREKEHHHHKSKKKNKDKHKHKDKDKEKKKKHKEKDRDKHKHKHESAASASSEQITTTTTTTVPTEPIKIKIQKDKIQLPQNNPLKIKISKDVIKTENSEGVGGGGGGGGGVMLLQPPSGGLKIKIPRDKISNCEMEHPKTSSSSRKRDRSSPGDGHGPPKLSKSSNSHKESSSSSKQNGRHSYSKVTQLGDGDTSIHRLAESKYINKNTTS